MAPYKQLTHSNNMVFFSLTVNPEPPFLVPQESPIASEEISLPKSMLEKFKCAIQYEKLYAFSELEENSMHFKMQQIQKTWHKKK